MTNQNKTRLLDYSLLITLSSIILTTAAPLIAVFVDGIFVGNMLDTDAFNAINVVMPITNLIMVLTLICNMGGCQLAAKAVAMDDNQKASKYFTLSLVSAILLAWTAIALIAANFKSFSSFLCPSGEGLQYVHDYLLVMLVYCVFLPFQTTLNNLVQFQGFPEVTTKVVVISNVANILLDYVFIVLMDGGIMGAAWATVASSVTNIVLYIPHFLRGVTNVRPVLLKMSDSVLLKDIFINGFGFNVFYIMTNILVFGVNSLLANTLGPVAIGVFGLCIQVQSITFCVVVGLVVGGIAVMGQQKVEGDNDAMRHVYKVVMIVDAVFFLLLGAVLIFAPSLVASIFGISDPEILRSCPMPLTCFAIYYFFFAIISVHTSVSYQFMGYISAKAVFVFGLGILVYLFMLFITSVSPEHLWYGFPIGGVLGLLATMSFGYYMHVKNRELTLLSLMSTMPSDVIMTYPISYDGREIPDMMKALDVFGEACELSNDVKKKVELCCIEFCDSVRERKLPLLAKCFVVSFRQKDDHFLMTIKSPGAPYCMKLDDAYIQHVKQNLLDTSSSDIRNLIVSLIPDKFTYHYSFSLNISVMAWKTA